MRIRLLVIAYTLTHSLVALAQGSGAGQTVGDGSISLEKVLELRDPFRRLVTEIKDLDAGKTELQKIALDQLKLVGIIAGHKKNKALLTTPDGHMHIVSESSNVGVRSGVIKKITPTAVEVEESITNILGRTEKIKTVLQFKKEKERL